MILFFDTSALVKFFHNEEGSEAVTELIQEITGFLYQRIKSFAKLQREQTLKLLILSIMRDDIKNILSFKSNVKT